MVARPAVVAFDVIETLMALALLRERFTRHGLPLLLGVVVHAHAAKQVSAGGSRG